VTDERFIDWRVVLRNLHRHYDAEVRTCNDQLQHARAGTHHISSQQQVSTSPAVEESVVSPVSNRPGLRDPVAEYLREPEDDVD